MRLCKALTTTAVVLLLITGCSDSRKTVGLPDAAVKKDVSSFTSTDVAAGHDDVLQIGGKEAGGADTEETGAVKDSPTDLADILQEQEVGGREAGETVGRDVTEAVGAKEVGGGKETEDGSEVGSASEAGTREADAATDTSSTMETGGPEVCTRITCNVDFPCPADSVPSCARGNPKSIVNHVTVSCAEICGTPCCSGAQCQGRPQDCPSGTACAYPSPPTTALGAKAECIDQARTCGGADNKPCLSGQYCEHWETLCTGSNCPSSTSACSEVAAGSLGTCMPLTASSECEITSPLCGCDGATYENECARKIANAARAHTGACP